MHLILKIRSKKYINLEILIVKKYITDLPKDVDLDILFDKCILFIQRNIKEINAIFHKSAEKI